MFVLTYLNEINERNIECVFDPLVDVVISFGGDGVQVLFLLPYYVSFIL